MASRNLSTDLSSDLMRKFLAVEATRKRMNKLHAQGKIYNRDLDHVYEGIFLKAVTSFEAFIETLFIGVLHNKYKFTTSRKFQKVLFPDKNIATEIILNGQSYTDWLPLEKLEKKANIYYEKGMPFTILSKSEKTTLTQIVIIRNAIAHQSSYSYNRFKKNVIDASSGIPDSSRTPAGFLRYVYRTGPNQTKFENYLIELISIANRMAKAS